MKFKFLIQQLSQVLNATIFSGFGWWWFGWRCPEFGSIIAWRLWRSLEGSCYKLNGCFTPTTINQRSQIPTNHQPKITNINPRSTKDHNIVRITKLMIMRKQVLGYFRADILLVLLPHNSQRWWCPTVPHTKKISQIAQFSQENITLITYIPF